MKGELTMFKNVKTKKVWLLSGIILLSASLIAAFYQSDGTETKADAFGSAGGRVSSTNFETAFILGQSSPPDFSESSNFRNIGGFLARTTEEGVSGILGDVNDDELANSTDALIVLSCDVGIDVSLFCPMNCGDVNEDGYINSTDALIILSYDVGIIIPFPVGQPGCPATVTPCPGCNP
jgi:hypothetical protein